MLIAEVRQGRVGWLFASCGPEVDCCYHVVASLVLVCVNDLTCVCVKHTNVLMRNNMHCISVDVPDLNEVRFEGQDPWVRKCEALRLPFPIDPPVWSRSPTIAVNKERKLGIIEKKFAVETLDMYWPDIFFTCDEIQRRICLVEKRLGFKCLQGNYFKASCTSHTKLRLEEVNRGGFRWNVEFLECLQLVLSTVEHLETLLFLSLGHSIIWLEDFDSS